LPAVGVKTALRVSVPTGRVEVWTWATPELTVTGLPIGVEPFSNCTVPVAAAGLTVAVSVSLVPESCGLAGEAASVVVVGAAVTVKVVVPVEPP
jgi:hypothetical protein